MHARRGFEGGSRNVRPLSGRDLASQRCAFLAVPSPMPGAPEAAWLAPGRERFPGGSSPFSTPAFTCRGDCSVFGMWVVCLVVCAGSEPPSRYLPPECAWHAPSKPMRVSRVFKACVCVWRCLFSLLLYIHIFSWRVRWFLALFPLSAGLVDGPSRPVVCFHKVD